MRDAWALIVFALGLFLAPRTARVAPAPFRDRNSGLRNRPTDNAKETSAMTGLYNTIMTAEANPLRTLPRTYAFQLMVYLSIMWSTLFCAAIGAWFIFDALVLGHLFIAFGFFVTAWVFDRASSLSSVEAQVGIYRDQPRKDGTARYDDVWGA